MNGARSSIGRLTGLLEDAFRLRRIIRQNREDNELQDRGFTVHHMVDTPIFRLFAEPEPYLGMVSAFPSLYRLADDLDDDEDLPDSASLNVDRSIDDDAADILFANALLTGEYIFQTAASGGDRSLLISPEHASEILGYIVWVERRYSSARSATNLSEELFRSFGAWLASQAHHFSSGQISAGDWLTAIRKGFVTYFEDAAAVILAPHRLRSIFERNVIRHAAEGLSLTPEMIAPDDAIVRAWRTRIQHAKRDNPVKPNPHALEADAITLAQLQMFNEQGKSDRTVCVLITNDRGLHRAYSKWKNELPVRDRRKAFYAVREPRQYMPILNVGDAAGYTDEAIFTGVERAVDQFISSFSSSETLDVGRPFEPGHLPDSQALRMAITLRMQAERQDLTRFVEGVRAQIDEVAKSWLRALEFAVVAKSDLLTNLAASEARLWHKAVETALRKRFPAQIRRVSEQFEALTASSALLRQELWAFARRDHPTSLNRRLIASEYHAFKSQGFQGKTIDEIIHAMREDPGNALDWLQQADRAERLLVTGCMCLRIGAWAAAKSLLGQARRAWGKREDLNLEIRFFNCVARRLAANPRNFNAEYAKIAEDLLVIGQTRDVSNQVRVRSEAIALHLCRIPFLYNRADNWREPLMDAMSAWQRFEEWEAGRIQGPQSSVVWQAVRKQFILNTFCLAFWLHVADEELPTSLRKVVATQLDQLALAENAYLTEGIHGKIYPLLARIAIATKGEDVAQIRRRVTEEIDTQFRLDANAAFVIDIPTVDKLELREVRSILAPDEIVDPDGVHPALER